MTEKNKADQSTDEKQTWETAANHAEKKADAEVEKIKKEAHEQLKDGKESFHNPDD